MYMLRYSWTLGMVRSEVEPLGHGSAQPSSFFFFLIIKLHICEKPTQKL